MSFTAVARAQVPAVRLGATRVVCPAWLARHATHPDRPARTGSSPLRIRSSTNSEAVEVAAPVWRAPAAQLPRPGARRDSDTGTPVPGRNTRSGRRSTTSPSGRRETRDASNPRATYPSRVRESARCARATASRRDRPTTSERAPSGPRPRLQSTPADVPTSSSGALRLAPSTRSQCGIAVSSSQPRADRAATLCNGRNVL
jgi:hypothetical protein